MPTITAENKDAWQALAASTDAQRPYVGRVVTITKGKYKGQSGRVTWHGPDAYADHRYQSGAERMLSQMHGREGYRIRVKPDTGDAFFVKAEHTDVAQA